MPTLDDFLQLDIRAGVIREVLDFPQARKPACKVAVDFGPQIGVKWSSAQVTNYAKEELLGLTVVAVINFPPRMIAGFMSEILILGVPGEDGQVSILTPTKPAPPGGRVY